MSTDNTPTNSIDSELEKIYQRCDVSNNRTDDPMTLDEFMGAINNLYISRQKVEEAIGNIASSIKQHTVPEAQHLVTRSYALNTLEYERAKLLPPTKGENDE